MRNPKGADRVRLRRLERGAVNDRHEVGTEKARLQQWRSPKCGKGSIPGGRKPRTADMDKFSRGEKCAARRYRNFYGRVLTLSG